MQKTRIDSVTYWVFYCPTQKCWLRVNETKETVEGRYPTESAALGKLKTGEVKQWHRPIQNYQLKLSAD